MKAAGEGLVSMGYRDFASLVKSAWRCTRPPAAAALMRLVRVRVRVRACVPVAGVIDPAATTLDAVAYGACAAAPIVDKLLLLPPFRDIHTFECALYLAVKCARHGCHHCCAWRLVCWQRRAGHPSQEGTDCCRRLEPAVAGKGLLPLCFHPTWVVCLLVRRLRFLAPSRSRTWTVSPCLSTTYVQMLPWAGSRLAVHVQCVCGSAGAPCGVAQVGRADLFRRAGRPD